MADKHHDELRVERTTPQGTQEAGVDKGYEKRDVIMRPLMGWMTGLAVLMIVTFLAMWGMWLALAANENQRDVLPTPMYQTQQAPVPGQPALLPNRFQKPTDPHTPWEVGQVERDKENTALSKIGLSSQMKTGENAGNSKPSGATKIAEDGDFMPVLPANAQNMVAAEQPKAGSMTGVPTNTANQSQPRRTANGVTPVEADLDQRQSDSSGGLRVEGRQQ